MGDAGPTLTGFLTIVNNYQAEAVIDLRNNMKCYHLGVVCTGTTIMDSRNIRCVGCTGGNDFTYDIVEDYEYGTKVAFIGRVN